MNGVLFRQHIENQIQKAAAYTGIDLSLYEQVNAIVDYNVGKVTYILIQDKGKPIARRIALIFEYADVTADMGRYSFTFYAGGDILEPIRRKPQETEKWSWDLNARWWIGYKIIVT